MHSLNTQLVLNLSSVGNEDNVLFYLVCQKYEIHKKVHLSKLDVIYNEKMANTCKK